MVEEILLLYIVAFANTVKMEQPKLIIRSAIVLIGLRYIFSALNLINRLVTQNFKTYMQDETIPQVSIVVDILYLLVGTYYKLLLAQKSLSKALHPTENYFSKRVKMLEADGMW